MRYILTLTMILAFGLAQGCDLCNCYLGLDPGYNKNTIGFRWNHRMTFLENSSGTSMRTMHGGTGTTNGGHGDLKQRFSGYELYVRYYPIPKLQISAILPYNINSISFDGNLETKGALSDLTLIAMYQLANTMTMDSGKVRHRIFGGLGVKFPTGKSSGASDIDIPFASDLYSGTGSTDYLALVSYIGKYRQLGWNVQADYKYNGESSNDYKFGNVLNITETFFYEFNPGKVFILPHAGATQEFGEKDEYLGEKQEFTNENIFWGSAGVDFYFGKFSVATNASLPFYQTSDESMPENKFRLYTSVNLHF